jgi:hypothetical protein
MVNRPRRILMHAITAPFYVQVELGRAYADGAPDVDRGELSAPAHLTSGVDRHREAAGHLHHREQFVNVRAGGWGRLVAQCCESLSQKRRGEQHKRVGFHPPCLL